MKKDEILDALESIPCENLIAREWQKIGMALHEEGYPVSVWESWSKTDPSRYHPGECAKMWRTFQTGKKYASDKRTIFAIAQRYGWINPMSSGHISLKDFCCIQKRDPISEMLDGPKRDPLDELAEYIAVIFEDGDIIPYVVRSHESKPGKYGPGRATYVDVEKMRDDLASYDSLRQVVGNYNPEAGAWIGVNSCDGEGQSAEHIMSYRFVVVECDDIPIREQLRKYLDLRLPIAALIHSGKRSLHAVVRVDASDAEQYAQRVDFLYAYLKGKGVPIDEANRNPNRWTRMPGAVRGDSRQWLVATDIGAYDFAEWVEEIARLE